MLSGLIWTLAEHWLFCPCGSVPSQSVMIDDKVPWSKGKAIEEIKTGFQERKKSNRIQTKGNVHHAFAIPVLLCGWKMEAIYRCSGKHFGLLDTDSLCAHAVESFTVWTNIVIVKYSPFEQHCYRFSYNGLVFDTCQSRVPKTISRSGRNELDFQKAGQVKTFAQANHYLMLIPQYVKLLMVRVLVTFVRDDGCSDAVSATKLNQQNKRQLRKTVTRNKKICIRDIRDKLS